MDTIQHFRVLQIIPPTPGFVVLYMGKADGETFTTPAVCLALIERWESGRFDQDEPPVGVRVLRHVVPLAMADGDFGAEPCDESKNYRGYFTTAEAQAIIDSPND